MATPPRVGALVTLQPSEDPTKELAAMGPMLLGYFDDERTQWVRSLREDERLEGVTIANVGALNEDRVYPIVLRVIARA
jgi:hypothetical protein